MTAISSAHDAIIALIAATLPSATILPDPYQLEATTSQLFLKNGYGVTFGPGENTRSVQSCQIRLNRSFGVVLTRKVTTTENDTTAMGIIRKQIFEDQLLLIKAFDANTLSASVSDVVFVGDGGLEVLSPDDTGGRFYVLNSLFECTYLQSISP